MHRYPMFLKIVFVLLLLTLLLVDLPTTRYIHSPYQALNMIAYILTRIRAVGS